MMEKEDDQVNPNESLTMTSLAPSLLKNSVKNRIMNQIKDMMLKFKEK